MIESKIGKMKRHKVKDVENLEDDQMLAYTACRNLSVQVSNPRRNI